MLRYGLPITAVLLSGVVLSVAFIYASPPKASATGDVPVADKASAPADEAQEKLEALRKRLPGVIARKFTSASSCHPLKDEDVNILLFRRFSATEAKVTISLDGDSLFTFYLSYYADAWTTTRHEENKDNWKSGYVIELALWIDQIGDTK